MEKQRIVIYLIMAILTGIFGLSCDRDPWPIDYPPTQSCPGTPKVNHGGETYPTVLIGNQCWMAKNLNIGIRIDHTQQSSDNDTIEKYCFLNAEENCDQFGGLYQWDELMQYSTNHNGQGLCPDGWHIPTLEDYVVLFNYAKGRSKTIRKKDFCWLIYSSKPGHARKNKCNENGGQTGFDVLPSGYIDLQESYPFFAQLSRTYMWISNHNYCSVDHYDIGFGSVNEEHLQNLFYSVRCIKDSEQPDID
jgi:uncharacterized protein (TIGR02145 family)